MSINWIAFLARHFYLFLFEIYIKNVFANTINIASQIYCAFYIFRICAFLLYRLLIFLFLKYTCFWSLYFFIVFDLDHFYYRTVTLDIWNFVEKQGKCIFGTVNAHSSHKFYNIFLIYSVSLYLIRFSYLIFVVFLKLPIKINHKAGQFYLRWIVLTNFVGI